MNQKSIARLLLKILALTLCSTVIPESSRAQSPFSRLSSTPPDWKDLPDVGSRKGPWVFSDKSMPFLLAGKYQVISVVEQPHVSVMPYAGYSYYLQRSSDLYRCDEVGPGNKYVECWLFRPEPITGRVIKEPNSLVGTWSSPAVDVNKKWQFTDNTVTTSEFGSRVIPCSFVISDRSIIVIFDELISGISQITFDFQGKDTVMFKSPVNNLKPVIMIRAH